MKKLSISLIMIIIWCNASSQVFTGIQFTNIGAGLNIGVESNNIAFTAGMSHPLIKSENPALYYSTVGYLIKWGDIDNPWSVGLHGGGAYSSKKVIAKDLSSSVDKNEFKGIVNTEVGKQWYKGVLYANVGYVGVLYYGISMKVFF